MTIRQRRPTPTCQHSSASHQSRHEFIQAPFWFLSKVLFFLFFYVWTRGTLPRFRYDQLMNIGWKLLLPVSIANVIVTAAVVLLRAKS